MKTPKTQETALRLPAAWLIVAAAGIIIVLAGALVILSAPAPKSGDGGTGGGAQNQNNGSANGQSVPLERAIITESRSLLLASKAQYDGDPGAGPVMMVSPKAYSLNRSETITLAEIAKGTSFDPTKIAIMCTAGLTCDAAKGTITADVFISVKVQATCNYAGCSLRYVVP